MSFQTHIFPTFIQLLFLTSPVQITDIFMFVCSLGVEQDRMRSAEELRCQRSDHGQQHQVLRCLRFRFRRGRKKRRGDIHRHLEHAGDSTEDQHMPMARVAPIRLRALFTRSSVSDPEHQRRRMFDRATRLIFFSNCTATAVLKQTH